MQRQSVHIAWAVLSAGYTSCIYFISLLLHIPFALTVILALLAGSVLYIFLRKQLQTATPALQATNKTLLLFAGLLILLTGAALFLMPAQPAWDAYAIWNFHARYLEQPDQWKQLFRNGKFSHPDYPALLPSGIAFVRRLTGRETESVAFAIAALTTLLVPVWLFWETSAKNLWVAVVVMASFALTPCYIQEGLSQYADTLLAMYFMGALICMQQYHTSRQPVYILLCTAMLGCAVWTKNEGIMLAGIFTLFYIKTLFRHRLQAMAGILPFLVVLLVYKSYAPANDLVQGQQGGAISKLTDWSRYREIGAYFLFKLNNGFYLLKIAVLLYTVHCIIKRQWPSQAMLMLATCFAGYCMVYVLTPNDLAWHLGTSADRLVHQLLPAAMYIIATDLSARLMKRSQQ